MERDITERLREMAGPIRPNVCTEAADEIERLRRLLGNAYESRETLTQDCNLEDVLKYEICELNLMTRAYYALSREGVETIGDLIRETPEDLLALRGFGKMCLQDVESKLAQLGLRLRQRRRFREDRK